MKYQLKIAKGNLKKSGFTTFLNLVGLTSAFTAFILIMLYVWNEYHFDGFHKNFGQIYRLESRNPEGGKTNLFMLGPTGETLTEEFPEVVTSTTYMPWGKWGEETFLYKTAAGEQRSYEDYAFSDENLTSIFSFDFIYGGSENPLKNPETAIVSEAFARKAWGNIDPIGKLLNALGLNYTVQGVFREMPENSILQSPIILRMPSGGFLAEEQKKWNFTNYPQFILTKPGIDDGELAKKINEQSIIKSKYRFYDNGKTSAEIIIRPLGDLRFTKDVAENPMFGSNNKLFVDSLFGVGILILLVALINYINFATANMPVRMKTFNINRIIGGGRWNSAKQIMMEAFIVFVLSFGLAFLMAYGLNHLFSVKVLGYELPFAERVPVLVGSSLVAFVLAIVAGSYPAFLSTLGNPVEILKQKNGGLGVNFRGVLTVFQFAATIALIVASVAIIKQVRFMEETDLGFTKNNTLVLPMTKELRSNFDAFRGKLLNSPYVGEVAASLSVPGKAQEANTFVVDGKSCFVWNWGVDDRYMDMMGFEIVDGRGFLKGSEAENDNLICNQTAAERYNWTVGTKIGKGELVGIMKDFNMVSLREQVDPFVFRKTDSFNTFNMTSIRLKGDNTRVAIATVKHVYEEFNKERPFRYFFLDDHLNMLYAKENQQARLITIFSLLSVIVSILGILGLSIFMCQQRIKEIGVRKVNGARTAEVMLMLNQNFVKWVVIAFVLATPLSWFIMSCWLESFAYKTQLSWWIFAVAGVLALGIALLTVSWQSWKAANQNPVDALRYE